MKITLDLTGIKELKANLNKLLPTIMQAAQKSLYESGHIIMARSMEEFVPVETGTLRSSGVVEVGDTIATTTGDQVYGGNEVVVTLGYGGPAAPYALAVHENPRAGKTGGYSPSGKPYKRYATTGQWKYLETPVKDAIGESGPVVTKLKSDIEKALETLA